MADYPEYVSSKSGNREILSRFEYLKAQYERESMGKTNESSAEEAMIEENIKSNVERFAHMVKTKIEDLKETNNKIIQLTEYKQAIIEILMETNKTQDKYMTLFEKNKLLGGELQLEPPAHQDLLHLLSRDLRGDQIVNNAMDLERLKNYLFITKTDYQKSMFDICERIDEKIIDETAKLALINDCIGLYKRTLVSFETDKKIFNKYKCTICYEKEVNMIMIPCGHTFCKDCSEKATRKCFACKGEVTGRTNIYLLGKDEEDEPIGPIEEKNKTLFGTNYLPA